MKPDMTDFDDGMRMVEEEPYNDYSKLASLSIGLALLLLVWLKILQVIV